VTAQPKAVRTLASCVRIPFVTRMSLSPCVVLSCVGRDLAMGRSPVQGVSPTEKFKGFTDSDVNPESEQDKGV